MQILQINEHFYAKAGMPDHNQMQTGVAMHAGMPAWQVEDVGELFYAS